MAIQIGTTPDQFNRNMDFIMKYLSQMNLLKRRETGREKYLEKSMAGYSELETQRHAGTMREIEQRTFGQMARDPRIQQLNSIIQLHKMTNKPLPSGIEEELDRTTMEIMTSAYKLSAGREPGPEDLRALGGISESFQKQLMKGVGDIAKQREQAKLIEVPKIEQAKAATTQRERVTDVREDELIESGRQFDIKMAAEKEKPGKGKSSDVLKTWFTQLGKHEVALINQIKNLTETQIGEENEEAITNIRAKLKSINAEREGALSHLYGETGLPKVEAPVEEVPPGGDWFTKTLKQAVPPTGGAPVAPAAEPEIPQEVTSYLKLHPDKTLEEVMAAYNAWLATQR